MAQKIITIVRVTGKQGSSVAEIFLREPGWHVRVHLIAGDLNDASSLTNAFAGSTIIFGVTDFWGNLNDPSVQAATQKSGRLINVEGYDVEVQQGRNIVEAANATVDTLERFVLSMLSPTRKLSGGRCTHNYHFDAKWEAVEYLRERYPELERKTSLLQVGLYMTNWNSSPLSMPAKVS
ncbi:hypothetical protein ONS95_001872 [Cadophora gregata]|uniref:uncharacterized protein n=1 Tax=Cadophora gregata TaxID=51156 RepID=UPI0026DB38B7|nr:uncharacterized protein ONS95_001872 [Cadophora gregata]KAK0111518.1 hypothetical protein ONS95_001872 [Cadophora gregata]